MSMRHPITMEHVVGNKIVVILHKQAYDMLDIQGIDSEKFVARAAGVDTFGLWIENPNFTTVPVYDDNDEYIPPEKRTEVTHRAIVLLQWSFIKSIMQFPDRPAYRGSVDEAEIGFRPHGHEEARDG